MLQKRFLKTGKMFISLLLLTVLTQPVYAGRFVKDYFSCISEEYLDVLTRVAINKDSQGLNHLLSNGYCYPTDAGMEATILKAGFTKTKVLVHFGNKSRVLWTPSEFVQP